ncbi:carboxypeptidase regulatory-like domain-containing protein [Pseudoalteromonas sp. PPB1]|uniref:carboxypeptidase regulatory-like domain-containing protein n=1 Tax=Pseudoalteromonas sp. PPB1 TaxID=2756136 RepID=UPI0018916710|nr:carboxypeptidase regulatory-like domain-containing protein [Pseudoalteromonas sp. PPB1]
MARIAPCVVFALICASTMPAHSASQQDFSEVLNTLQRIQAKLSQSQASLTVNNQPEQAGIPEGEDLFLSVYADGVYLGEVFAVKSKRDAQVELRSLFAVLDFAISDDNQPDYFTGWYLSPERTFLLDSAQKRARVNEQEYRLSEQDISHVQGEVFVESALIADWFGLHLQFNYSDQRLLLQSPLPLPALERQARANRKVAQYNVGSASRLAWKPNPYQILSSPLMDTQFGYRRDNDEDAFYYSVLGAHDLAFWNVEYFIAGTEGDALDQGRFKGKREDAQGRLLGQVQATQLEVGDIQATHIGTGQSTGQGIGVRVSDKPLNSEIQEQSVQISGSVQAGWDVELYHNDLLVAQQLQIQTGRYDFDRIPLYFGSNQFELVKYGPQGQVEREQRSYFVEGTGLKSGQGYFDVSVTDNGSSILNNDFALTTQSGLHFHGRYDLGLSDSMSVYAGIAQALSNEALIERTVTTGGTLSLWKKMLLNLDLSHDSESQHRARLSARTEWAGQAISAGWQTQRRLLNTSKVNNDHRDTRGLYMRMSGMFNVLNKQLSYQNQVQWNRSDQDTEYTLLTNRLSLSLGRVNISNQVQWQSNNAAGDHATSGQLRFQTRLGRIFGRLIFDYDLHPHTELIAYETRFYRSLNEQFNVELSFRETLETDYQKGELGLNWLGDKIRLNSQLSYDSYDEWEVGINGQFSFGYHPQSERLLFSQRRLASNGAVLVKVYLDHNANGVFDELDEVVPEVRVRALQNYMQGTTDEQGLVLLSGMPVNQKTDMVIDTDSLAMPFVTPAIEGMAITPRRGYVEYLELPLVNTSEIEGVVYQQTDTENAPVPYADVTLLDEQGAQIARTQAAYDGYYVFTDIKPGRYRARVANATKRGLTHSEQVEVALSQQGDVLVEVDLQLAPLSTQAITVLSVGRFTSLPVLKTYAMLLRQRHRQLITAPPFYLFDDKTETYMLGIAFTQNDVDTAQLQLRCNALQTAGVPCQLEQTEIKQ